MCKNLLASQKDRVEIFEGDAERLTYLFPARSFDFVIDIESSFYYPDKVSFFQGVHHVLKDDGIFVMAFYI